MSSRSRPSRSWDEVADWYAGWSGPYGGHYHKHYAIPALLELLEPLAGASVLDLGCGPGPLAPAVVRRGARYTGVDSSRKLIAIARRHHGASARFLTGDATDLRATAGLEPSHFSAVAFLLSLQDIDPLEAAIASAASILAAGGRLVALLTHPCFRIPRQSGWGWDDRRQLRYRRIDRYLGRLDVPMQPYGPQRSGATRSYHRPLGDYVAALAGNGLAVDALREIAVEDPRGKEDRAATNANREIPLFLALRAVKLS